jgi:excisionase family DNA binding protein
MDKLLNRDAEWLRPLEVAELLRVTRQTVYNWIDEGRLSARRVGARVILVDPKSVLEILGGSNGNE